MFEMNGGKTMGVFKAGTPGYKSNIEAVLTLYFNTTNVDDYNVFDDFAYIQHQGLDLFMVVSLSDYKVAIGDMASPNKDVSYVMLKETPCLVHRSPSAAATTTTKMTVTYSVFSLST